MKIAVVTDNMSYGGKQSVCVDYINILREMGHEVVLYNLDPKKTEIEQRLPRDIQIIHYSFPLNAAPTRYYIGIKAYWYGKYLFPIIYLAKKIELFFRKLRFPYKNTEYDLAIAFGGHYNDLTFVAENFLNAKKKLCWTHGALYQNFIASDGFLDSYLKIRNIIVLNETAQEEVIAANHYLKLDKELSINKLYNPVKMEDKVIDENKVKALQDQYGDFALMVARLNYPHKDQYTVIKAFSILKEKYNLVKNIVFLGDGPDRKNFEQFAHSIGMQNQCHFVGAHDDVQNYYAAAKMLVHSSIAFEGFALILVEAMYYDIPVISTDTMVGPRDVLGNNEFGLLCHVKDPEDMASKIASLYTNEELYRHYVEKGRERKNDFTYEVIKNKLENILENLM